MSNGPTPAVTTGIPAALYAALTEIKSLLERQGVVQFQEGDDRHGSYRLRYREFDSSVGFTRHRSLSLGRDPSVAEAVTALLQQWQDDHHHRVTLEEAVAAAARSPAAPPPDPARAMAQTLCGGGWRRQKQIGEWYDLALDDPTEMMRFAFTGTFPAPRKAGRPPKKRLW